MLFQPRQMVTCAPKGVACLCSNDSPTQNGMASPGERPEAGSTAWSTPAGRSGSVWGAENLALHQQLAALQQAASTSYATILAVHIAL